MIDILSVTAPIVKDRNENDSIFCMFAYRSDNDQVALRIDRLVLKDVTVYKKLEDLLATIVYEKVVAPLDITLAKTRNAIAKESMRGMGNIILCPDYYRIIPRVLAMNPVAYSIIEPQYNNRYIVAYKGNDGYDVPVFHVPKYGYVKNPAFDKMVKGIEIDQD